VRVLRLALLELRRFRTPLERVALAFVVGEPLLYGALYLWSNWDPYDRLDTIPVAVVDADRPVTVQGDRVAAGELFTDQLRADPLFDWRFVDGAEADRGLDEGRYYFVISVPADFSAKLASGAGGTPQRASMSITLDDANGFIVGKMAETVQAELQNRIDAAAVSAYFQSVFGNLDRLRSGLSDATDGAGRLRDGAGQADAGATSLADGLTQLRGGADQLAPGARQVADGVGRIRDAVVPVANRVADAIPDVTATAAAAAPAAADLATVAADAASDVNGGADSVTAELARLGDAHPELAADPGYQAALAAARRAADRTGAASTRAGGVRDAARTIADGTAALAADAPRLQGEVRAAADQVQQLADGADRVADGAEQLDTGLRAAETGAHDLATGTAQLATGAQQLTDGLAGARDEVPVLDPSTQRDQADVLASPVDIQLTNRHPATVYGRGMAPLFFGIALWVFNVAAFLLLRPLSPRALASRAGNLTVALSGFLPLLGSALAAAALLYLVVDLALGLDPVSWWGTAGLLALAVAAFVAIGQLLRSALGGTASAVVLVLLVLQLTAGGGLYPVETLPAPFRAIHPLLPMSYVIDGLRVTISGGSGARLAQDVAVLAGFAVAAFALSLLVVRRQRVWTIGRLKPELEL
jgi:putative membrane protein